ncbi:Dps family protein [Mucilaginibacter aquariorum]|uniref:DNA starvation/stationary phase protection protein n=1 Tax=Mucilaginibacter aquariorum TaxID=2967225 RepID=A0ABT1SZR1_9SPHI|nr:DNA starvation/stationary phase protection protein [Mucilaginibacter aquariorum]MCQ6957703.1 DNA starvation/stationary phase protection protein [Mucilaginibacter aquariorum]
MEAKIGISSGNLAAVAHSLSKILADEYVLYTKTRKAHWNIEGPDFYNKHKFFEEQYNQLEKVVDNIGERIRKLGHYAPGSLKQFLELTHLTEDDRFKNDAQGYIKMLLADHESILIHLRGNIDNYAGALKDAGTSDYITNLMETHETMAWMLRAHLL